MFHWMNTEYEYWTLGLIWIWIVNMNTLFIFSFLMNSESNNYSVFSLNVNTEFQQVFSIQFSIQCILDYSLVSLPVGGRPFFAKSWKNTNFFIFIQMDIRYADSRCALAYLFFPSGSSESPKPASAEGASLMGRTDGTGGRKSKVSFKILLTLWVYR